MLQAIPTIRDCEAAVQQATRQRAAEYRATRPELTNASIAERVTGITGQPVEEPDGWWLVGIIDDAIGDQMLDVLYRPRRLATRQQHRAETAISAPSYGRIYNDGSGGWRDSDTGEPASSAEIKRYLGVMEAG